MTPAQLKHLTPRALLPFACRNNTRNDERIGVLHYVNGASRIKKFCPNCEALERGFCCLDNPHHRKILLGRARGKICQHCGTIVTDPKRKTTLCHACATMQLEQNTQNEKTKKCGYPGCDKHILDTSEMCKPHAIRARHARRKETR